MKRVLATIGGVALAGSAAAYDPSVTAPQVTLKISGATASESALLELLTLPQSSGGICLDSATKSFFSDQDPVNLPDDTFIFNQNFAVACTADGTTIPGLSGTQRILVIKSGAGGSGNGVGPVCDRSTQLGFLDVINPAACSLDAVDGGFSQYDCAGNLANDFSDVGISDVGPTEVFGGVASTGCGANVFGGFVTVFGIPVTTKLRDALQIAQGIAPCKVAGGTCTVDPGWWGRDDDANGINNEEEPENQPSISSSMNTALKTGAVARWSNVSVRDPNNGGALTALNNIVGLGDLDPDVAANYGDGRASGDDRVTICRRVDTSGTRAQDAVVMNRRNCTAGAPALTTPSAFDFAGPTTMPLNSGSSNMARCLTNMNDGVDYNTNQTSLDSDTGSLWAVGQQSTDKVPQGPDKNEETGTRDGYRFVKVDGKLPTFENVANGSYSHYGESTIQWAEPLLLTANELAIAEVVRDRGASASALGSINNEHDWGFSGLMAFGSVNVTGGNYNVELPTTPLTRGGNNCLVARKSSTANAVIEQ